MSIPIIPVMENLTVVSHLSAQERRRQFAAQAEADRKAIVDSFVPVPDCPLITPYTRYMRVADSALKLLYAIRKGGDFSLPTMPRLREIIDADTPKSQPMRLRGYQKQMIIHHALMPRLINGDSVGLGKTISALAGACAVDHAIGGGIKVIIFTTTTTAYQWETETKRFTTFKPWVLRDAYKFKGDKKITYGHAARLAQLQKFLELPNLNILVCRYTQWTGRRRKIEGALDADGRPVDSDGKENLSQEIRDFRDALKGHKDKLVLVLDETHKIKTPGAQIRNLVVSSQRRFSRVWGLTATVIKNNLEEFYSVASAIGVAPLGSLNQFWDHHVISKLIQMGRLSVPKITGYRSIPEFKVGLRPWYWGRSQAQVKEPMPKLTTVYHYVDMDAEQTKLLLEDIPLGLYVLPPTLRKVAGEVELVERDPSNLMTMLSVYQLVANSPALLDISDEKAYYSAKLSPKEEMLLDLLDGDLQGEKVIVYTKFRTHINRLQYLTDNKKFTSRNFLRITGGIKPRAREVTRLKFQDDPDYDFIMINSAAIEGVNLQSAAHLICLDYPWSWGDFLQLVGRMVRMASPHSACTLHILCANGSVDEFSLETLLSKKGVFERILGSSGTAGMLDDGDLGQDLENAAVGLEDESDDKFMDMLKAHAKTIGLRPYVTGVILAKEVAGMRTDVVKGAGGKAAHRVTEEELDSRW